MSSSREILRLGVAVLSLGAMAARAEAACTPVVQGERRPLAVISDLHMAFGRADGGDWDAFEDFRWSGALEGILQEITNWGGDHTDLVIAGDMLELWQPRDAGVCQSANQDLGCTVDEMVAITQDVIAGHPQEFAALRGWSQQKDHHLYLVPGNHDSALLLERVQSLVENELQAGNGHVTIVKSGIWQSSDCRVHVEHGHQIPLDPNSYGKWPDILDAQTGRIVRPWGEWFVQQQFNDVERGSGEEPAYPLIDNLSPEIKGAWYRASDRGSWTILADVADFIQVGLLETSWAQRGQWLGATRDGVPDWDVPHARDLGFLLFARAMPPDDPMRAALLVEPAPAAVTQLRAELDRLAREQSQVPEEFVRELCTRITAFNPEDDNTAANSCRPVRQGLMLAKLPGVWGAALASHIEARQQDNQQLRYFIYGHTHQLEAPHPIGTATVVNTGAFQRVIDDPTYQRLLEVESRKLGRTILPGEGLRVLRPEDLPACYTVMLAKPNGDGWSVDLKRWQQDEDGTGQGFLDVGGAEEKDRCRLGAT